MSDNPVGAAMRDLYRRSVAAAGDARTRDEVRADGEALRGVQVQLDAHDLWMLLTSAGVLLTRPELLSTENHSDLAVAYAHVQPAWLAAVKASGVTR